MSKRETDSKQGRECQRGAPSRHRLHGRVVKGVGHLGHNEAMEVGGREFDPRPGHYSRMSF